MTSVKILIFEDFENPDNPPDCEAYGSSEALHARLEELRKIYPDHDETSCGGLVVWGEISIYVRFPSLRN